MLNARRAFDPRWPTHHRKTVNDFMTAVVQFWRPQDPTGWDSETNELVGSANTLLWEGPARLQDNKDWRSRDVDAASDPQMLQYIRVQIPISDPVAGVPPHLDVQDMCYITSGIVEGSEDWYFDPDLTSWTLHVRNTLNSSYPWLRNVLCVVDLSQNNRAKPPEGSGS